MRLRLNTLLRRPSVLAAAALVLLVAGVWGIASARAAGPQTLDQRVRVVASQIQCPVCHGESVADSPSAIAEQMRSLIRQQLTQGMSDQQILQYFRDRYGDGILETPPAQGFNALMWLGPLTVLFAGLLLALAAFRAALRPPLAMPAAAGVTSRGEPASDPERERLRALLHSELADAEGLAFGQVSDGREEHP